MPDELLLIGTLPCDLRGPERLKRLLRYHSPDAIAVELSQDQVATAVRNHRRFIKKYSMLRERLLSRLQLDDSDVCEETVRAYLGMWGFEGYVSEEYASERNIPLACLDDEGDLISTAGDETNVSLRGSAKTLYDWNRKILSSSFSLASGLIDEGYLRVHNLKDIARTTERNKLWAEKIMGLSGRVVVVAGGSHTHGPEPNLQTLLAEYQPTALLLNYLSVAV